MTSLIFLAGLTVAALFAIFANGAVVETPSERLTWIDMAFWTIIVLSSVPLVSEFVTIHYRDLRSKLAKRKHRNGIPTQAGRTVA